MFNLNIFALPTSLVEITNPASSSFGQAVKRVVLLIAAPSAISVLE